MILVQKIETRWTKQSRGGELARIRNELPETLQLPVTNPRACYLLHNITYSESDRFCQPHCSIEYPATWDELSLSDLEHSKLDDGLEIHFRPDPRNAARFRSSHVPRTLRLSDHEWGQIVYNARFVGLSKGEWWYGKIVYNIATCSNHDRVSEMFLLGPPKSAIKDLRYLR